MDNKAIEIVRTYIEEHLDKSDQKADYEVYIVWKMQNASELEVADFIYVV